MESLRSTGIWLLNVNRDNQRYVVDLKNKLSDIDEMYGDLVRQSSGKQSQRLTVIQEADDYEDLLEDLCQWLDQKEKFVARQRPLTANADELKTLVNEQKVSQGNLEERTLRDTGVPLVGKRERTGSNTWCR